jgi:hypothetical protein
VPLEVEFPLEMLVEEDVILGRVYAVEGLVGRHDRARSGADGLSERGEVELVKLFPTTIESRVSTQPSSRSILQCLRHPQSCRRRQSRPAGTFSFRS